MCGGPPAFHFFKFVCTFFMSVSASSPVRTYDMVSRQESGAGLAPHAKSLLFQIQLVTLFIGFLSLLLFSATSNIY